MLPHDLEILGDGITLVLGKTRPQFDDEPQATVKRCQVEPMGVRRILTVS